ncbi:MAG: aminotransferase class III-fold pyridoxal phosphate-dependent enzyme [Halobacteriales archaeon]|nr:aminotransferase class III-fold pyridoxal phosphate-dependent enzyme [Halobacteriales archaeon]
MGDGNEKQDSPALAHFGQMSEDHPSIAGGDGCKVYDEEGNEYLDFSSQLYCVNAGHGNERILDAMREQLDTSQYVSSAMHSDVRTEYARRLVDVAPEPLDAVFFSVSGSEANEAGTQIARELQDAGTVLTRWRSYHGSTYATAGMTGDPAMRTSVEGYAGTTGSTKFLPPFDGCDSPFDAETPEELAERAGDHLEYVVRNQGPDSIAGLVTEVVGGSSGAFTPPPGYFDRVREICDEHDILLIADEVITGFGRCGDWFACDTESLKPDMLTFAKGATSAYVPLAGVLVSDEIAEEVREKQPAIGQTFAGNPIGCAGGLAALEEYDELIGNVRELEHHLRDGVGALEQYDAVGDVRGRGFLWCAEFVDPETGEPLFDPRVEEGENPVKDVIHEARDRGVLVGSGRPGFQVMVAPPLCASKEEIDAGIDGLVSAVDAVFGER